MKVATGDHKGGTKRKPRRHGTGGGAGGSSHPSISGEGLVARLEPIKGVTPKSALNQRVYLPATVGDLDIAETANHAEYDTLSAGQFSQGAMGGAKARQFRTLSLSAITMDFEPRWFVVTGQDQDEVRKAVREVLRSRKAVHLMLYLNPSPLPEPEFDGYVTLRQVTSSLRGGEVDTRYLTVDVSEWRDPNVARRTASKGSRKANTKLPTTHVLRSSDTLDSLSYEYYGTYAHWRAIRDANGISHKFGQRTPLMTLPLRWKLGSKVKIPRLYVASDHSKSKTSGRHQRSKSKTAQTRTPNLSRYYRYRLPGIAPGEFAFRLDLLRPKRPPLSLDKVVETLSWDDEQAVLAGNLTAHRPDSDDPASLPIVRGQQVRCRVEWDGPTYELWTMRTKAPQTQLDTGVVSVDLEDDMAKLDTGKQEWWFRKTHNRRFGYTADEVAREVGRRLGIGVRSLVKGTTRFELKLRRASGLDVLRAAYQKEKAASQRSFVIRLRDGQIEVTLLRRNPIVYVLAAEIQTALLTQKAGASAPVTVLTGHGHLNRGKNAHKLKVVDYDHRAVRAFGYVPHTKDYGRVTSLADLRSQVRQDLADGLRFADTITIQHQGIPFILRGDGERIDLAAEGYAGRYGYVFCTRANHSVQAASYTSTFDFDFHDPYLALLRADAKAAAARAKKRAQRKRAKLTKPKR